MYNPFNMGGFVFFDLFVKCFNWKVLTLASLFVFRVGFALDIPDRGASHKRVQVIRLHKDGRTYSRTYSLKNAEVCVAHEWRRIPIMIFQPAEDFLKDSVRKTFVLNKSRRFPDSLGHNLVLKNFDIDAHRRTSFFSKALCEFLEKQCESYPVTEDMVEGSWLPLGKKEPLLISPKGKKALRWSAVSREFYDVVIAKRRFKEGEVFAVISGEDDILWGKPKRRLFKNYREESSHRNSVYRYEVDALCARFKENTHYAFCCDRYEASGLRTTVCLG